MNLCKIEHVRCGEYDCASYVMAPDDMGEAEFDAAVERAERAYIAYAEEWSARSKAAHPGYQPPYDKHPDKTVAEIKADFEAAQAAYEEWKKADKRAQRSFKHYLKAEGFRFLWDDNVAAFEATVNWGHRHGSGLNYELPVPDDSSTALKQPDKSATAF